MEKGFDYPGLIGNLSAERRIEFYERLCLNLTIGIRAVWSDEELSDGQKTEAMKAINEIMHRLLQKGFALRRGQNDISETDSWETIRHWVAVCPTTGGHVGWAVKTSYEKIAGERSAIEENDR